MAPQVVEMNLKVPSLTVKTAGQEPRRIDNSQLRFTKQIELPSIPKAGLPLQMTTSSGTTLDCLVTRSDWDEGKNMFIVSCSYANRSISHADYEALVNSADWTMKPLF